MSTTNSYTISREIEGALPIAKGHTEKMRLWKKKPHPVAAGVQVTSSEEELQEGRCWLLFPHGNTGDRLKRRGEKNHFTASLTWTRKGSRHQQTNQRWKLMRSRFHFSSIILLIFFWLAGTWALPYVLGSARTELIFTRNQEETQPGRLTETGQTKQGIKYHVLLCRIPVGELGRGRELWLGSVWGTRRWEFLCAFHCLFCIFSLSVLLLLLFPLFAVLLKCPCPNPWVFAFFFPFSSPPQQGEGQQSDRVALLLPATAKLQQRGRCFQRGFRLMKLETNHSPFFVQAAWEIFFTGASY